MEIYNKLKTKSGLILDPNHANKHKIDNNHHCVYSYIRAQLLKLGVFTQLYGITLTLSKKFELDDPIFMHRLIENHLTKRWKSINYIIFPEYSCKNARLHYHGVIWDCYKTTLVQKVRSWRRKFGFAKIELKINTYNCNRENHENYPKCCWMHYIQKDKYITGLWAITNYNKYIKIDTDQKAEDTFIDKYLDAVDKMK